MKNRVIAVGLLAVSLSASAQNEFTIEGKVDGIQDSTVIILFRNDGDTGHGIGRDTIMNGAFRFRGQAEGDGTEMLSLSCMGKGIPSLGLDVWVAPGADIRISGHDKYMYNWDVKSPFEQQDTRHLFVENARDLWTEFQCNLVEYDSLMMKLFRNEMNEDERGRVNTKIDSLRQGQDELLVRIAGHDIELMKKMPVSEVWMDKLCELARYNKYIKPFPYAQDVTALYGRLTEEQKQTETGRDIHTCLFPPMVAEEGDEMADADLFDLEGNTHRLADYKGKYMLVDIWSAGCGPCILALPEMKEIAETYRDKLTVISLSCDREKTWRRASQEHDMTWENLSDLKGKNGLYARYGVEGIPSYVLISPDGKVVKKWMGYGEGSLKAKLQEAWKP